MLMKQLATSGPDITLSGPLTFQSLPAIWNDLTKHVKTLDRTVGLHIDLADVDKIDSAGVAFLGELPSHFMRPVQFHNIPDMVQQAIDSFSSPQTVSEKRSFIKNPFESIADFVLNFKEQFIFFLYLTADVFYWSVVGLVKKKGQRQGSFFQQSILIGVDALPIVGLISFLIGLILALQSAAQLRQFGANIFVADLIGIAMLREMGPIMTAIVVSTSISGSPRWINDIVLAPGNYWIMIDTWPSPTCIPMFDLFIYEDAGATPGSTCGTAIAAVEAAVDAVLVGGCIDQVGEAGVQGDVIGPIFL